MSTRLLFLVPCCKSGMYVLVNCCFIAYLVGFNVATHHFFVVVVVVTVTVRLGFGNILPSTCLFALTAY